MFNQFDISGILLKLHLKLFPASPGILSIQFLFSLLWTDFLKPMGMGFVLTIFGIITANLGWKYTFTIPYTHPMLALQSMMKQVLNNQNGQMEFDFMSREIYVSLIVAALTFIVGYFVIHKRSIK